MEHIRQYLLSIISVGIICAIINNLINNKGGNGAIIRMMMGLIMSFTLISPIVKLEMSNITSYIDDISFEADNAVENGLKLSERSLSDIIKQKTEAYIMDKAAFWELNLKVEVTLSRSDPPAPESVVLIGKASPYAKSQLTKCIANDLGISEEHQKWM